MFSSYLTFVMKVICVRLSVRLLRVYVKLSVTSPIVMLGLLKERILLTF